MTDSIPSVSLPLFVLPLLSFLFMFYNIPEEFSTDHTFKNKSYLLASMVAWRTFNIYESFPLHNKFFIVENNYCSLP